MAVGLSKKEIGGPDARKAELCNLTPPLPPRGAKLTISYPGKISEEDILQPRNVQFVKVADDGSLGVSSIQEDSLVWADNWLALNRLVQDGVKAKLIYLDPPYATGLGFASRSNEHAYSDSLTEATYIEFMRRRFVLMRELLDDDGSIYVHIGHQMVGELKLMLDEVFGRDNFINLITRRKCSSKNFTKSQYSNLNDYILFYTKGKNYIWNKPSKKPEPEWIAKEYSKVDERGQFKLVPVHAPGVRHGATGGEWRGMMPPPGKHWQYSPDKLEELDANGEIHWSKNGNPRRKIYFTESKSIGYTDYWDEFRDAHNQNILVTGYPTEKNFDMMKLIVEASSNPGDLVIDPFCGSGSTLHAASALGRKWIGIDESFAAAKTVINRLKKGRTPMGDFVKKDKKIQNELPLFSGVVEERHEDTIDGLNLFIDALTAENAKEEVLELFKVLRIDPEASPA